MIFEACDTNVAKALRAVRSRSCSNDWERLRTDLFAR